MTELHTNRNVTLQRINTDNQSLRGLRKYLKYDFSFITGPLFYMFARAMKKGAFQGVYLMDGTKEIGYAIVKDIPKLSLTLVKFLAIIPEQRSGGYGSVLVEKLKKQYGHLILEVEDPDAAQEDPTESVIRTRRIQFYERNGLQLDPDLKFTHAGYPLRIMSTIQLPQVDWLDMFRSSHNQLYGLPIAHWLLKARR